MSWRLVYKDKRVWSLFESNGNTYTNKTLFIGGTLEDCFGEIDDKQLNFSWPSGDTKTIIFSGGTRTIVDNEEQ